jgi:hypothetical protein
LTRLHAGVGAAGVGAAGVGIGAVAAARHALLLCLARLLPLVVLFPDALGQLLCLQLAIFTSGFHQY